MARNPAPTASQVARSTSLGWSLPGGRKRASAWSGVRRSSGTAAINTKPASARTDTRLSATSTRRKPAGTTKLVIGHGAINAAASNSRPPPRASPALRSAMARGGRSTSRPRTAARGQTGCTRGGTRRRSCDRSGVSSRVTPSAWSSHSMVRSPTPGEVIIVAILVLTVSTRTAVCAAKSPSVSPSLTSWPTSRAASSLPSLWTSSLSDGSRNSTFDG